MRIRCFKFFSGKKSMEDMYNVPINPNLYGEINVRFNVIPNVTIPEDITEEFDKRVYTRGWNDCAIGCSPNEFRGSFLDRPIWMRGYGDYLNNQIENETI